MPSATEASVRLLDCTHMHADRLSISFLPAYNRCDQYQSIFGYEIPYTPLVFVAMAGVRLNVEFEGGGKREDGEGKKEADDGCEASHIEDRPSR